MKLTTDLHILTKTIMRETLHLNAVHGANTFVWVGSSKVTQQQQQKLNDSEFIIYGSAAKVWVFRPLAQGFQDFELVAYSVARSYRYVNVGHSVYPTAYGLKCRRN